jgi:regulator of sigma E protease
MGAVIQISQLLLSLSILVLLHELGHFLFARMFGTRIEKFYLFFNPWFSVFKLKRGDTEYGIGWLPLGGYVKISGMLDESLDKEQLKQPPKPYEFRSKPTGQRLLIMLGGVLVNLLLGFLIYSAILFTWGQKYLPNQNLTHGIWCADSTALDIGFLNGDKILTIDGKTPQRFDDIYREVIFGGRVKVWRNGSIDSFDIPHDFVGKLVKNRRALLFYPRVPFIIREIPDTSLNRHSGLMPRDQIVSIKGVPVQFYDEYLSIADTLEAGPMAVEVLRNGRRIPLTLTLSHAKKLEILSFIPNYEELEKLNVYKLETRRYNIWEAIPAGFRLAGEQLTFYIRQFKLIFDFKSGAYKGLGGFGTIGGLFPKVWDWQAFWEITAFLSLILAFMNVLPIPALDGGHVLFLFYEMVTRRKPNEKFMEYAQVAGMVLIFGLLILANLNDLLRWIAKLLG